MTVERAVEILRRRVRELDDDMWLQVSDEPERSFVHFVRVLHSYYPSSMGPPGSAVIEPAEADGLIDSSRLMASISNEAPSLADGPLLRKHQHWIATRRHTPSQGQVPKPTKSKFGDPRHADDRGRSSLSPVRVGLSTSTPAPSGNSMWEMYLDLFHSESTFGPRFVWNLETLDVPVLEVHSATDWVRFGEDYGRNVDGLIYPDWAKVTEAFAGVHLTARAVAATQGFSFETESGITAPAFWDVEQTLWLRWVFNMVSLVAG